MFHVKQTILSVLFCSLLVAFSSLSWGADWKVFYQVEEGLKYYYDKDSIVKPQKDTVQVWMRTTLNEDDADESDEPEQYRGHLELNCKSKMYTILEEAKPAGSANVEKQRTESQRQGTRRLALESAMGSLWINLCQ